MATNDYHFVTTWRVPASPDEISAVLSDAAGLARWWPSVYLQVRVVDDGDRLGVGRVVDLWTKGFLPYTLRWRLTVTESDPPHGFSLAASGDFVGRGTWTLRPELVGPAQRPSTLVTYDWLVLAEKGLLKTLSAVMKPIFSANHHWAMARGEESLRLELARRRAGGDALLLDALPQPPGPTFPHNLNRAQHPPRAA